MNTNYMPDIQRAKLYLKQVFPVSHTPDFIKERLGLRSSASTVGRKLRAAAIGPNPELKRSYYRNERKRDIAIYASNQDYEAPEPPVKVPSQAPALFFYTRALRGLPSPFYMNLVALKADIRQSKMANPALDGFYIYGGSYEAPVLLEVVK